PEAQRICQEFQSLKGQPFDSESDTGINGVLVSPFGEESKKRFFLYYLLFDDAEMALHHDYKGLLFDVMVIASAKDNYELLQQDIYTWLAKNKCLPLCRTEVAAFVPVPVSVSL